MNKFVG